jgi:hypothetical protein
LSVQLAQCVALWSTHWALQHSWLLHVVPQCPQLLTSLVRSTHAPLQHQLVPVQPGLLPHTQSALPPPLLAQVLPFGHPQPLLVHLPETHTSVELHTVLQSPQWSWFDVVSMQPAMPQQT